MDPRDVQTLRGICPTHGEVEAIRPMPRYGFPFLVSLVRRAIAARRPYRCPECDQPVRTS